MENNEFLENEQDFQQDTINTVSENANQVVDENEQAKTYSEASFEDDFEDDDEYFDPDQPFCDDEKLEDDTNTIQQAIEMGKSAERKFDFEDNINIQEMIFEAEKNPEPDEFINIEEKPAKKPMKFFIFKTVGYCFIPVALIGFIVFCTGFDGFNTDKFIAGAVIFLLGLLFIFIFLVLGYRPDMKQLGIQSSKYKKNEDINDFEDNDYKREEIKKHAVQLESSAFKKRGWGEDKMFCKFCGEEIDGNSNFCSHCGRKLD